MITATIVIFLLGLVIIILSYKMYCGVDSMEDRESATRIGAFGFILILISIILAILLCIKYLP